jgi:hypothetical protein
VCFIYAGLQVFLCLPLVHGLVRAPVASHAVDADAATPTPGQLTQGQRRHGFWLLIVAAGFSGLVSWGLPLYFVAMFREAGMNTATAIILASVTAYATFFARVTDFALAGRVTGVRIAAAASLGSPLVFVMMLAALGLMGPGLAQVAALAAAMAIYGIATGLIATSRATLPFELFGSSGYASMLGRLSFFLNLTFAASPLLFAFIYDRAGQQMALWFGLAGSLCAAIAYLRLDALVGGMVPRQKVSGRV